VKTPFGSRGDPYSWLRDDDRKSPEVLEHLKKENEYCKRAMEDTEPLQAELFGEMKGRIQEADRSAEVRRGAYYHYTRTREGGQYRVHCRRQVAADAGEETEASTMNERHACFERTACLNHAVPHSPHPL
jgi:oligopeptidase B